ncbi:hypothetical protein PVAP13_9NG094300 [Panicum virgatum]|uniref:Uncharacterized protein n=1 Tax=Panicum virgatum TaxID=38727 RepID=A0A8T0MFP3_PANVG|nr:hypothetical protein PVAP13_9NG094300 [Panicum virgatum]
MPHPSAPRSAPPRAGPCGAEPRRRCSALLCAGFRGAEPRHRCSALLRAGSRCADPRLRLSAAPPLPGTPLSRFTVYRPPRPAAPAELEAANAEVQLDSAAGEVGVRGWSSPPPLLIRREPPPLLLQRWPRSELEREGRGGPPAKFG